MWDMLFHRLDYALFVPSSGVGGWRNLTAATSVYDGEGFLCGDSFSR
jgi:hypothetical protein